MKNGPTTCASDTACAPAPPRRPPGPAASWREAREPSARSGCGTGRSAPRSGQVPTTTCGAPRPEVGDRLLEVAHRLRDRHPMGDVVAADDDHRDVGAVRRGQASRAGRPASTTPSRPARRCAVARCGGSPSPAGWPAGPPSVSLRQLGPEPGRDRVAHDEQLDRGAVLLLVLLVGVGSATSPSGLPISRRAAAAWRCSSARRAGTPGERGRRGRGGEGRATHEVVVARRGERLANPRRPLGSPRSGRRPGSASRGCRGTARRRCRRRR